MKLKRIDHCLCGLLLVLTVISIGCGPSAYYVETMETLKRELGTNGDPLYFMVKQIKPGRSREEVRKLVRHYNRLEEQQGDVIAPGGVDKFHYASRPGKDVSGNRGIIVLYDAEQRVISASVWDM